MSNKIKTKYRLAGLIAATLFCFPFYAFAGSQTNITVSSDGSQVTASSTIGSRMALYDVASPSAYVSKITAVNPFNLTSWNEAFYDTGPYNPINGHSYVAVWFVGGTCIGLSLSSCEAQSVVFTPVIDFTGGKYVYNVPIGGCMDTGATNYNSAATFDDGSCTFPPPPVSLGDTIAASSAGFASTTGFNISAVAQWAGDNLIKLFIGSGIAILYALRFWIVSLLIIGAVIGFSYKAFKFFRH